MLSAILLIGLPGVGKGTQGKLLGKCSNIFHVSTGELLRALPLDTDDGRFVANRLKQGLFAPDDMMIRLWQRWLVERTKSGEFRPAEQTLLLDGIPRNVHQCEMLRYTIDVQQVIFLNPTHVEPVVQRLRQRALIEGRADDANETVIRKRLEVFRNETAPVLDFYPQGIIREIDPLGTPQAVFDRICVSLCGTLRTN